MKMPSKKRDELKSLIQKVELDKPSLNFTDLVMEEIKSPEPVINPALKILLKRNGIENLSMDFTHRIITQVEGHDFRTTFAPIVTRKAWFIILSAISVFVLYLVLSKPTVGGLTHYFVDIGNALNIILTNVYSIPSLFLITIISMGTLMLMDYLLRIRNQSHQTKSGATL